jgi:iron complex transport system ATP-binding protein
MTLVRETISTTFLLSAHGIGYQTAGKVLLRDIDLQVPAGKFIVIVGPNGAGKSTLLRLLSGELQPTAGRLYWQRQHLCQVAKSQLAKERAVLPQQHQIAFPISTDELVMMGRYPHFDQIPSHKDFQIVDAAFEQVNAQVLRKRQFLQLSGGEQQRILLAQAFAQVWESTPGMLLLDEPTNNLDLAHQQQLLQAAREMCNKGCSVLAILHDLNLAMHFADHILLLHGGQVWEQGSPELTLNASNIKMTFDIDVRLVLSQDSRPLIVPDFSNQNAWVKR